MSGWKKKIVNHLQKEENGFDSNRFNCGAGSLAGRLRKWLVIRALISEVCLSVSNSSIDG